MPNVRKLRPRQWRTITVTIASDRPQELDDVVEDVADLVLGWADGSKPAARAAHREVHLTFEDGVPEWIDSP